MQNGQHVVSGKSTRLLERRLYVLPMIAKIHGKVLFFDVKTPKHTLPDAQTFMHINQFY